MSSVNISLYSLSIASISRLKTESYLDKILDDDELIFFAKSGWTGCLRSFYW